MLTRQSAPAFRLLLAETVAALLFLAALLAIAVELRWLLAVEASSLVAVAACVGTGFVALAAPPATVQVGSRIAGLAAIAIGFPVAVLSVIPEGGLDVDRIAGASATATSIAVAEAAFDHADSVVIVSSRHLESSAPAAAFAARMRAPIVLTPPGSLSGSVVAEIDRLGAETAYLVGDAPSGHLAGRLELMGLAVERLPGDGLGVAADVARRLEAARVLLVVGDGAGTISDPDTWEAMALAGARGTPVVFSGAEALSMATAGLLLEVEPRTVQVVAMPGASTAPVLAHLREVLPGVRVERFADARATLPDSGNPLWVAAHDAPADLLVASAAAAHRGALAVADPEDRSTAAQLRTALDVDGERRMVAVGGTAALPDDLLDAVGR